MSQLGETLRERRIALGITLEQAEEHTKIRAKLLSALEGGDHTRLPNPGYVRGYISSYARYLELDTVPLLAMYRAETGAGRYHEIAPPDTAVSARGEQHAVPSRVAVIVVVVLAVLSIGIWAALKVKRGPEKPLPIPTTAEETPGSSSATEDTAATSPGVDPSKKAPAKYTPFTVKVTLDANGASWVDVSVDGKSAYAGALTGGQSKSFEVTRKAILKIGRPSVVTVYRDGKETAIADSGGTPTLVLTANPAP